MTFRTSTAPVRAAVAALAFAAAVSPSSAFGAQTESSSQATVGAATSAPAAPSELTVEQRLLRVKRIYVESFGDDATSKQVQSMVVDSLMQTKRFVVTENKDRADAILKGTALEKTSQELHAISESGNVATASTYGHAEHSGQVSGSVPGYVQGSSRGSATVAGHAQSVGIDDSQATTETVNDARISVRLVDPDGDVLWTTTQESNGAKYKGATADAADKVAKQLMREIVRLEKTLTNP